MRPRAGCGVVVGVCVVGGEVRPRAGTMPSSSTLTQHRRDAESRRQTIARTSSIHELLEQHISSRTHNFTTALPSRLSPKGTASLHQAAALPSRLPPRYGQSPPGSSTALQTRPKVRPVSTRRQHCPPDSPKGTASLHQAAALPSTLTQRYGQSPPGGSTALQTHPKVRPVSTRQQHCPPLSPKGTASLHQAAALPSRLTQRYGQSPPGGSTALHSHPKVRPVSTRRQHCPPDSPKGTSSLHQVAALPSSHPKVRPVSSRSFN